MTGGPPLSPLLAAPESRCPEADDAGDGAVRRLERAPAAHAAAVHAAARGQLQSIIAAALIEMGDFEVVDEALAFSSRHDEGRARSGTVSRSAAAASEMALGFAAACASNAPCQRAFASCAI